MKRTGILLAVIILIAAIVPCASVSEGTERKTDIYNEIFQAVADQAPSERYVTGTVFDLTQMFHDEFEEAVRSSNAISLWQFFAGAYKLFCEHPEVSGIPIPVNMEKEDTDYRQWNTDIFPLESGDFAALCYMPVSNNELEARIIGIILSEGGDGYYYCMLKKDENETSTVFRNRSMRGITVAGEVKGRGFDLMHAFLNCIQEDFSAK